MLLIEVQPPKAYCPTFLTLSGTVTLSSLLHVHLPRSVTESGTVILVTLVHSAKALCPSLVTVSGMLTSVRLVQP